MTIGGESQGRPRMPQDPPPQNSSPAVERRSGTTQPAPRPRSSRAALRVGAVVVIAAAAVLLYRGLHDRFFLPECDSDRARRTLADVLKQLRLEPVRYEPIKTISSSKTQVVCNATLPLPDGGNVVVDFSFYWQGSQADMKYSVSRRPAGGS
jgi:hypothetical protein